MVSWDEVHTCILPSSSMQIAGLGTRGTGTCGTGTAGLGHALQRQRDWDMRNWDSFYNVNMGKIVMFVLFVLQVSRSDDVLWRCYWDRRYKDSGTGTCGTGTAGLGHALQEHFVFVIRMLKKNFGDGM